MGDRIFDMWQKSYQVTEDQILDIDETLIGYKKLNVRHIDETLIGQEGPNIRHEIKSSNRLMRIGCLTMIKSWQVKVDWMLDMRKEVQNGQGKSDVWQ